MLHRTISIQYWSTVLSSLALMTALTTFTPTLSHAIPVAGDYIFTSGLVGGFTSDGTQVTKYLVFMEGTGYAYGSPGPDNPSIPFIVKNDQTSFDLFDETRREASISLLWDTLLATHNRWGEGPQGPDPSIDPLMVISSLTRAFNYRLVNTVPEPSVVILLGVGLLVLIGYSRQQRRQAELQAGHAAR